MFWARICFYVTTDYNNPKIMPDIFKEIACNKKYVALLMCDLIIKTLSLIFYDKKAKSEKKNETKIRVSNLVKQKL